MNLYQQVHAGAHCNARMLSSKADFCVLGFSEVAILIFRSTFESWYSMLFFRFSTTKRQFGLSTHQASQDQARRLRWCWRLARRRWTVSVCPVSTQHTESHGPGVFPGGFAQERVAGCSPSAQHEHWGHPGGCELAGCIPRAL